MSSRESCCRTLSASRFASVACRNGCSEIDETVAGSPMPERISQVVSVAWPTQAFDWFIVIPPPRVAQVRGRSAIFSVRICGMRPGGNSPPSRSGTIPPSSPRTRPVRVWVHGMARAGDGGGRITTSRKTQPGTVRLDTSPGWARVEGGIQGHSLAIRERRRS